MSLARRPMLQELDSLRDRLDRFFQEGPWVSEPSDGASVALDVQETDDAVVVAASVPGIKLADLSVEARNGVLTIRGESEEEHEETEGTWHRRERWTGRIYRAVTLPTSVDESKAEAKLEDGVLKIQLPKDGQEDSHRIPVQSG